MKNVPVDFEPTRASRYDCAVISRATKRTSCQRRDHLVDGTGALNIQVCLFPSLIFDFEIDAFVPPVVHRNPTAEAQPDAS
jgi:hypothetical protein